MDYENLLDSIITKEEINKIQLGGAGKTTPTLLSSTSSTSSSSSISSPIPSSPDIIKGSNTDPYLSNNSEPIPQGLLRIIDDGIDDIIRNIKNQFGDSVNNQNTKYKLIYEKLQKLKNSITTNTIDLNNNDRKLYVEYDNTNDIYKYKIDPAYYAKTENMNNDNTIKTSYKATNIMTLDDDNTANAINPIYQADRQTATHAQIRTRLENCQLLEMLYLIKHEELMKTFVFTLNLFDKYKYAIKILLYILKNLLAKKDECPSPGPSPSPSRSPSPGPVTPDNSPTEIKLPATLIPNIKKLLDDQAKVQEIIDNMKLTIQEDSNEEEAINLIKTATNNENSINNNLT